MQNKILIQTLDSAIEKSQLALDRIEEHDWEGFIVIQEKRQVLMKSLETQTFDDSKTIIDRLRFLSELNKDLLEKSQTQHHHIKAALKNYHKAKSATKAYQQ